MKVFQPIPPEIESSAKTIVDSALKVHRALGPGLLESVYELCLVHELRRRGVPLESQVILPITYEGLTIDAVYGSTSLSQDRSLSKSRQSKG